MPRKRHQIENIYETLELTCARCVFRFVGVQFLSGKSRSWNKLLHNALIFLKMELLFMCVFKMQSIENGHLQDLFLCDNYFSMSSRNRVFVFESEASL
jgi:hypothetical protein